MVVTNPCLQLGFLPSTSLLVLKYLFHLILTLLFQSQRKPRKLDENFNSVSRYLGQKIALAKAMMGAKCKLSIVKCKVCSFDEKKKQVVCPEI